MQIRKEAGVDGAAALSREDLALINHLSKKELTEQEVYTFSVRLCDNEVDRDGERFAERTLEELAGLFVGKSGVFDHQWSAKGQTARIYRTEIVREEFTVTAAGVPYCYLKGCAYMLRTEKNRDLIEEIEGGIKREVSVGCAVERAVCSLCGEPLGSCPHEKGQRYDGKLCWAELEHAIDAYEWSFVAVPAQKKAGVLKKGLDPERLQLEREAALGRKYLESLRADVVRLGAMAEPELKAGVLKAIAGKLDEGELLQLKGAYEARAAQRYPLRVQLPQHKARSGEPDERDSAFLL